MGVKGNKKFPKIIKATLKAYRDIGDDETFVGDCNRILEALVAEFDEEAFAKAMTNQGMDAEAHKTNFSHLRELALARRPLRLQGTEFDAEEAVAEYRKASEALERAKGGAKKKLEGKIKKMRLRWKEWEGDDSLHEVAFSEPSA